MELATGTSEQGILWRTEEIAAQLLGREIAHMRLSANRTDLTEKEIDKAVSFSIMAASKLVRAIEAKMPLEN